MTIDNKKIAIIGGGPGGLTLARLLQLKGADVKVYERDANAQVRQQGATLDLHEDSGLRALTQAGLMDEFKKYYRLGADKMKLTDQHAVVVLNDHDQKETGQFGDEHFRPEIDRGPLRDILIASLKPGTIEWNAHYQSMEKRNGRWLIHFKSGKTAEADLLIAADGANSKIRSFVSDIQPVYSGITIVEGNIYHADQNAPQLNALVQGGKLFALGKEKSIILSAKGEGSLSFYTGTKEAADWVKSAGIDFDDKQAVLKWFRQRFNDWDPLWEELFSADEMYIVPRPMYHYPLDQSWVSQPDITLIGDAAHRMPPYAGEGVNMAMLDALELSECLTAIEYTTTAEAISAYEIKMLKRAGEVTEETLRQTEALHGEDGLEYLVKMFSLH
ncbi:MAG: 2-polyprenyl-6-methoxyphenol hydroxylase [Citrobacter freundii]|nr:MAG: 2-polyprenyl-6-methoxyphenol hydroxylase [Citrobacter freundii]